MINPFRYIRDNWGKEPEPRPPIVPGPWRIPFFIGVSVLSVIALALLVTYVIIPGIRAQQQLAPAPMTAPAK